MMKSMLTIHRKLFNESKESSDSGWGKALGTTALIAGTMYGAKKGAFGNTIRRGYNTAYGQLGNAIGSKSMVKSAANDWAKGSVKGPGIFGQFNKDEVGKYKRDLVAKRNEFMKKNWTPSPSSSTASATSSTTTPTTTQSSSNSNSNSNSNSSTSTSKDITTTSNSVPESKPKFPAGTGLTANDFGYSTKNRGNVDWAFAKGTVSYKNSPSNSSVVNSVMQSNSKTINQRPPSPREQRLSTGQSAENYRIAKELGYKVDKTEKPKLNFQERKQERIKRGNTKNAGLMGISNPDSNTFYATPEMFKQKTMSILSRKRYFSSIMLNIFR